MSGDASFNNDNGSGSGGVSNQPGNTLMVPEEDNNHANTSLIGLGGNMFAGGNGAGNNEALDNSLIGLDGGNMMA